MKKIKFLGILIFSFFTFSIGVFAAGTATLTVNSAKIENGNSVKATVTVKNTAAWNITITSSGVTSGCTQKFVGDSGTGNNVTQSFTVTCKSTSTGIINFVMSGDITSSDGTNTKISGSKSVTVVTPRAKSTNNKLNSLSVDGFEITPAFNKDVNEYSVTVPTTTTSINIKATKADNYSKVSGDGEKNIEEGVNVFEIIVTSETGVSNVYKLTVNVLDENPIEVEINNKKYTVVKIANNLVKPNMFEETTVVINDFEIPAFINEISKITLVGLKDESGNIELFIYDNGEYTKYNEFQSSSLTILFMPFKEELKDFTKTTLTINNQEVEAYKSDKKSLYLLYGINLATGKSNYYSYDSEEETIQKYLIEDEKEEILEEVDTRYLVYALSLTVLLLLIIVLLTNSKSKKLKKLLNIKEAELNSIKIKEDTKEIEESENKKSKKRKKK